MIRDHLYPADWLAIARMVKEANGWVCQSCGRECQRPGEPWRGNQYLLTVAHYDQVYDSPAVFVVALCSTCHLAHDAPHAWKARRRIDRLRQRLAGQLELIR